MADAESILRELLSKIAREHNFGDHELKIKPITSGGANYTSALFLVTVKSKDKEDVEIFAKVACVGEKLREIMSADRLYFLEAYFYKKLMKIYKALEARANVPDEDAFVIPKFYGCNTNLYEETIILENLTSLGYGTHSRFVSVDWKHAASSVETMAKLHALSFAYQNENPKEFDEVCKDIVFVENKQDDASKAFWENLVERALSVVQEKYKPKIVKLLEDAGEDGIWKFRRPLGTKTIVHGDFRPSNMLYKRQQDNTVHAIVVDYQTIHVGSPAADFVYFLLSGTDSAFRAEHYDRLVEHYYRELSAATQRLGVDVTDAYPREVFDSELKEMLPLLVILGIFLLPIVLVDAEQAPKVDGDGGIEAFAIPSNKLYAERFSGIVEDCVRWGAL
ncbi:hypothetical protein O0L34_g8033 [Tuta absoluta]|nr:hypothetical protein O0L34_g8033 [Tuta absoluta]